jgi:hypothetical protein
MKLKMDANVESSASFVPPLRRNSPLKRTNSAGALIDMFNQKKQETAAKERTRAKLNRSFSGSAGGRRIKYRRTFAKDNPEASTNDDGNDDNDDDFEDSLDIRSAKNHESFSRGNFLSAAEASRGGRRLNATGNDSLFSIGFSIGSPQNEISAVPALDLDSDDEDDDDAK